LALALTRWNHYEGTTMALFISLAFAGSVSAAAAISRLHQKAPLMDRRGGFVA
jgi:hypothetical protein